jgi:predicted TIM-barrel fold metal-dependent hydrolase
MKITNCHIHIFTIDHIPDKFLPFNLVNILRPASVRKPFSWVLRNILPFTDRDLLDRYMKFVEVAASGSQEDVLKGIKHYYPAGTGFVVLPMDMSYMYAGNVKVDLRDQLLELSMVKKKYPDLLHPFIAVDPRREGVFDLVKEFVEEHGFEGIKIYPRTGFYPNDDRLYPIYEYAQKHKLPIMSHCSRGGVYTKKVTDEMLDHPVRGKVKRLKPEEFSHYFTEPSNYDQIMTDFPQLKMCLAHFGGNLEWDNYLEDPWDEELALEKDPCWVSQIIHLMKKHSSLYTDISYTAFHSERYFPLMSILLNDDSINDRILFGSDYFMVEQEKKTEREMAIKVRYALGEEKFTKIASSNVRKYLKH